MRRWMWTTTAALGFWLLFGGCSSGEHPSAPPQKEHPASGGTAAVTKDQVADAVVAYVREHLQDGHFVVEDREKGKTLRLTLDKVHRERLAPMGGGRYFVCADMRDVDGTVYDLDFFVVVDEAGQLRLDSEIWVHKEAGEPRYTWAQEGGVWKRKPLGAPKAKTEHPREHPKD